MKRYWWLLLALGIALLGAVAYLVMRKRANAGAQASGNGAQPNPQPIGSTTPQQKVRDVLNKSDVIELRRLASIFLRSVPSNRVAQMSADELRTRLSVPELTMSLHSWLFNQGNLLQTI